MRFQCGLAAVASIFILCTSLPTDDLVISGYTPPRDIADGVYYVPIVTTGNTSGRLIRRYGDAIKIANITDVTDPVSSTSSLPISERRCVGSNEMDPVHHENALLNLGHRCDSGQAISASGLGAGIIYSKYGSAIVYGCSFGGQNPCSTAELREFDEYMDRECGDQVAGWVFMKKWQKRYGRNDFLPGVCGRTDVP
ncbi:hypothetical protein F5B20DRAFT_590998 [Whalleya microplaca]|nr:hypothetical protein F5B20DRAFT_590998 [Whalleya microplaca]